MTTFDIDKEITILGEAFENRDHICFCLYEDLLKEKNFPKEVNKIIEQIDKIDDVTQKNSIYEYFAEKMIGFLKDRFPLENFNNEFYEDKHPNGWSKNAHTINHNKKCYSFENKNLIYIFQDFYRFFYEKKLICIFNDNTVSDEKSIQKASQIFDELLKTLLPDKEPQDKKQKLFLKVSLCKYKASKYKNSTQKNDELLQSIFNEITELKSNSEDLTKYFFDCEEFVNIRLEIAKVFYYINDKKEEKNVYDNLFLTFYNDKYNNYSMFEEYSVRVIKEYLKLENKDGSSISLYKFAPINNISRLATFKEGKSYLANPKDWNDPFDCNIGNENNLITDIIGKNIRMQSYAYGKTIIQDIKMWAHYADNHNGICVKYKYSWNIELENLRDNQAKKTFSVAVLPIKYLPKKLPIQPTQYLEENKKEASKSGTASDELLKYNNIKVDNIIELLTVKSDDWKDEKEFRLIYYEKDTASQFKNNNELGLEIEAIYLGYSISKKKDEISLIKDFFRDKDIPIYRCDVEPTTFKLNFTKI